MSVAIFDLVHDVGTVEAFVTVNNKRKLCLKYDIYHSYFSSDFRMFVLFDLILYVPSTIFQLNRDGSSWVEPVLS